ncbi:MAG: hypothetical protein SGJ21_00800 [Alphaproteobacteria bacterium]|nr:hypothetical protein [Alphaproteobacteria bacterium]
MLKRIAAAALAILAAACSEGANTPDTQAGATPGAEAGRYKTDMTMQELMARVIDPAADGVWLNQGWVIDSGGTRELFPTDEAGWFAVESAAASIAETSNLLLLPGRAVDDERWTDYAHKLYDAGINARKAAESRDKQAFFDAGGAIYVVCRDCHARFILGEEPPAMQGPPPPDPSLP